MSVPTEFIDGSVTDTERALAGLREALFTPALQILNKDVLPVQFSLFKDDVVPTNQRNLGDVRTRMGVLLEYELGKAITLLLTEDTKKKFSLTYVIANKFPDLAFRGVDGSVGVRFEVKAVETIAEEKAANFDTLIKDIRKGTDFIVVLVWEWQAHGTRAVRYPHVYHIYVLDAYQLAQLRDCYWLNTPPKHVGDGRQGYDLYFGVNCKDGNYNQEEGNYGKLMRVFDPKFEKYLPEHVQKGTTLRTYYEFQRETIRIGSERIGGEVADAFLRGAGSKRLLSTGLPVVYLAERGGSKLLIVGDNALPRSKNAGMSVMRHHGAKTAIFFNEKFDWRAVTDQWTQLAEGNKPAGAKQWAAQA